MKILKYLVIAVIMATSFSYAEKASAQVRVSIGQPVRHRTVVVRRPVRRVVVRRPARRVVVTRRVVRRPYYRRYRHY